MRKHFNRFTSIGGTGVLIGTGMWITQGGLKIPEPAPPLYWFGVALMVMGVAFGVYGWFKPNNKKETSKYHELYDIAPILHKMDRHLWGIANSYKVLNVNIEAFNRVADKINELMGIRPTEILDPKKSIENLINDTRRHFADKKKQVEVLLSGSALDKNHKLVLSITKLLDSEGYGLKSEKTNDRIYKNYKSKLEKSCDDKAELVDSWLSYLINLHVHVSEFFANSLLVMKRLNWITSVTGVPSVSQLVGVDIQADLADLDNDTNERLSEIRTAITDYLRELEDKAK